MQCAGAFVCNVRGHFECVCVDVWMCAGMLGHECVRVGGCVAASIGARLRERLLFCVTIVCTCLHSVSCEGIAGSRTMHVGQR